MQVAVHACFVLDAIPSSRTSVGRQPVRLLSLFPHALAHGLLLSSAVIIATTIATQRLYRVNANTSAHAHSVLAGLVLQLAAISSTSASRRVGGALSRDEHY